MPNLKSVSNLPRVHPATVIGGCLLIIWSGWWIYNLAHEEMLFTDDTWIRMGFFGPVSTYGVDFLRCVDRPTRFWLADIDQYADKEFLYAPIINRLYIWVALTTPENALRIWICLATACAAIGSFAAIKVRRDLGLDELSPVLALALILFSTPVLYSLQRGNFDLLVIPAVVASAALMQRDTRSADALAGLLLAVAVWCKIYPALLGIGLLALGRWRAAAFLATFVVLIGLAVLPETLRFIENLSIAVRTERFLAAISPTVHVWSHTLTLNWPKLWAGTPLAALPGELGSILLLGPLLTWLSWRVYRCQQRDRLVLPYLFWVVAAASFVPVIANDYSLAPLPLAILATWGVCNRWSVHVALGFLLIWWQPVSLPIPGSVLMFIKLAGLIAAAVNLVDHALQLSRRPADHQTLQAPTAAQKQPAYS
jgi:Glycosyltransferase family 87